MSKCPSVITESLQSLKAGLPKDIEYGLFPADSFQSVVIVGYRVY
ncbi:hypothetical protein [Marinilactibacillus psychrotolerans]